MILDVQPVSFWLNGRQTFVDNEGRMGWNVGPNQQQYFRVVRNPELQDESATWQCDCGPQHHKQPTPIINNACDHIVAAYFEWAKNEAKKQQMKESVNRHVTAFTAMQQEAERNMAAVKPTELPTGFVSKQKRTIIIKD